MKRTIKYIFILLLAVCAGHVVPASARPARLGAFPLMQPDGTTFTATLRGDEFMRIRTTTDGHAIIQEEDGWWCYAIYEDDGSRFSSGFRVGKETPASVLSQSRMIPTAQIGSKAASRRETALFHGTPLLGRLRNAADPLTRSGQEKIVKHGIVILAQFKDNRFKYTREDFINMLTQEGYSAGGAIGSAKEYFDSQFSGEVEFLFDISEIVTVSGAMAYYGGNDRDGDDKAPAEFIRDACRLADEEIDFSLYDDDGDGEVDNVFVFFAGNDEADGADENCLWSHAWYVYSGAGISLTLDGKRIDRYACTSELSRVYTGSTYKDVMAGIGTFCHEYSHTFGLPDLYDTDYDEEGGWAAGLWLSTSLMDGGNQNNNGNTPPNLNAIEREILGLSEPVMLEKGRKYTLSPIEESGLYYRADTDKEGEYYLFECRAARGWDTYIGGSGMLVYHIDKSAKYERRWLNLNTVNAFQSHQCADLVEADSRSDAITGIQDLTAGISGIFFPGANVTSLTPDSTPALKYWSGTRSDISVTAIRREGENITFSVIGNDGQTAPPAVEEISYDVFTDAAIISFRSGYVYEGEATVTWKRPGKEADTTKVMPFEPGRYAVLLEGLEAGSKTYMVSIHFDTETGTGESADISFMTKKRPSVSWPYIYLGSVERKSDGTFPTGSRLPLILYNASGAAEIRWTYDGNEIVRGTDCYFTPAASGTLKALVRWEDGRTDIISKEIILAE